MKRFWLILFLFGINAGLLFGQRTMLPSNAGITISYFGDAVVHPGFNIGLDYPILIWENRREVPTKNGGYNRTRSTQLITQPSLGFYTASNDHNAVFFRLEAGYRNIHHRSTFGRTAIRLDVTGGAAFMLYSTAGDGSQASDRTELGGSVRTLPVVALALAQDYKISAYMLPVSFFARGSMMFGNSNLYPGLEVGLIFRGLPMLDILPSKVAWTRN
ncbi:MAG: hypothetical protein MRZ79_20235 [Bacteroidia bacterium]|nr:hypothetical protein [Bacteroidia bacterium]